MATRKNKATEQAEQETAPNVPDEAGAVSQQAGDGPDEGKPDVDTFRKVFVVSLKGIDGGADTLTDEAFHNANKVATLQELINAGYRATGDVSVAGQETEGEGPRASLRVTYSVGVVRADKDERHPSEVPNPRETIIGMGGSTTGDLGMPSA